MPLVSTQSKLFITFLRLIRKKGFLKRQLAAGKPDFFDYPEPPSFFLNTCQIDKFRAGGRDVFKLKYRGRSSRKHILYLHGGAYVQGFVKPHWLFLHELTKSTGCSVIAPDYPLAPASTCKETVAMVLDIYKQLISTVHCDDLILMGDSSGGGLALALAQELRNQHLAQPARIILLSPWLDITLSNQEIKRIDRIDPFLGIDGLLEAGKAYAGSTPPDHYWASPIYGSLKGLREIVVFVGSNEILVADTRKLRSLAVSEGITMKYYEYAGMFHAWMLLDFPESRKAKQQIINMIKGS